MAGTAQAAELIRCDRCSGHYVVDASGDGKPRVRCNTCGHLRETAEPAPMSVPGKWTVIGPDGKAMTFDTWEELTESRRPSAITTTAKAVDETRDIPRDRRSASALLDITPEPHKVPEGQPKAKLALADMDSALDLGEVDGRGPRRSTLTSTLTPGSAKPGSERLEPLPIRSFSQSQAPKTQHSPKVEWAPKIDAAAATRSDAPRGDHDHTLRVEMAPPTARVIEAERPTAPNVSAADDSIDELDPDSLIEDGDGSDEEDEAAPLSLRDAMPDSSGDPLSDDDLEEEDAPDPHEALSLRDLVVVPPVGPEEAKPRAPSAPSHSQAPPPPRLSQAPKPEVPKPSPASASQAPPRAVARSQAPPPPRPQSLSRPDVGAAPPPQRASLPDLSPSVAGDAEDTKRRRLPPKDPATKRGWILGGVALAVLLGIAYRVATPEPPKPKPVPTAATVVPPTPVTTPPAPAPQPPPTETVVTNTPPTTGTVATATPTVTTTPTVATNPTVAATPTPTPGTATANPTPATNTTPAPNPTPKPTVASTDSPGSMSDLLDKAGSARRKGDYATARDLYQRVLAMSPTNVEANGGLGDVARAQGDLAGAKASYERALAASPTYTPAQLGLADVEWDQGNRPSATKRYAQVVDRMGDRAPQRAKERSASAQ